MQGFEHLLAVNGLGRAGDLAYTTLLAIVPLMIVSLWLFSDFPAFQPYVYQLHKFLFEHLVPSSAQAMQNYIESFAQHAGSLSTVGLLFALVTSMILIFTMESTFNRIWNVKQRRQGFRAFLIYLSVLLILPPLAAVAFTISVLLFSLPYISTIVESVINYVPVFYIIPVVLSFFILLVLYKALPNCEVSTRCAIIGATIAALLFELTKIVFGTYITHFTSFTLIYGTAAVIPIFLVWLFILWVIVIIGAIIAYKLQIRSSAYESKK